ncbi:MAG: hypothetical protein HC854_00870 [Flavobacterium sp.]|nr:hypothetical protein [Flavobacterium sp.]
MITKLNPSLVVLLLFFFQIITGQNDPTVLITDQNNNTGTVTIDCDYNF